MPRVVLNATWNVRHIKIHWDLIGHSWKGTPPKIYSRQHSTIRYRPNLLIKHTPQRKSTHGQHSRLERKLHTDILAKLQKWDSTSHSRDTCLVNRNHNLFNQHFWKYLRISIREWVCQSVRPMHLSWYNYYVVLRMECRSEMYRLF